MSPPHILVVGAGAAGTFAAISAAETLAGNGSVTLCEATAHPLAKVRISGGGRCNVTHACFDPRELTKHYPRGARELRGPFHRFGPADTVAWFERHGVALKVETDGRMFPVSDDSDTIVSALSKAALSLQITLRLQSGIRKVETTQADTTAAPGSANSFRIELAGGEVLYADRLVVASGGLKGSGPSLAEMLGHSIEPPVPSLFTFHVDDPRIEGLAGISVDNVAARVEGTKLEERGPLLITHWGMSGPAVLKLSAWGARELAACSYRFALVVNFSPVHTHDSARASMISHRNRHPRRQMGGSTPFQLPGRLWSQLVAAAGANEATPWTQVSNDVISKLAAQVVDAKFQVTGKSTHKEEFVTCGGVRLAEVDFQTMESRKCAGLHFAGEVLDIDGITGGFNFQAAWTTGWLAGRSAALSALGKGKAQGLSNPVDQKGIATRSARSNDNPSS